MSDEEDHFMNIKENTKENEIMNKTPIAEDSSKTENLSEYAEEIGKAGNEKANSENKKIEEEEKIIKIPLEEMRKLKDEANEFKNKYWLLLAESENARKRLQKEKQELTQYSIQNIVNEILHPLDTFENALKCLENASEEIKNWGVGFKMILNQFKDVLSNHDIISFSSEGKHFNPHYHEAVEVFETEEYPDGLVIKEFLKGYKMGDRVIRPARVKVAKTPKEEEQPEEPCAENEKENTASDLQDAKEGNKEEKVT